jgi:putative transposase
MKVSFRQNQPTKEGGFAVRRKRFSVEQIVAVLKQAELGVPVAELIRQVGITEQTLYRWKKQYKGLETDQVRQFKQLQDENARLKRLVAELSLDKTMLQDVLAKKL